jgi:hypothetical protein
MKTTRLFAALHHACTSRHLRALAFGIGLGSAFGVALHSVALGCALGVALGLAFGAMRPQV